MDQMELRDCLLSSVALNESMEEMLNAFGSWQQKQRAWLSLPESERLSTIAPLVSNHAQHPIIEAMVPSAMRIVFGRWAQELKHWLQDPHPKNVAKIATDALALTTPDFPTSRESQFQEQVIRLLYDLALEPFHVDEIKEDDLAAEHIFIWENIDIPAPALLRTLSKEELQEFLHYYMRETFADPSLVVAEKEALWKDEYRRGCLRFLDPRHRDWKEFQEDVAYNIATIGDPSLEQPAKEFYEMVMHDLTLPPSASWPAVAPPVVARLHTEYDFPASLSVAHRLKR